MEKIMDSFGLTLDQEQPYARIAYAHARDDMELSGGDVTEMDTQSRSLQSFQNACRRRGAKVHSLALYQP